VTKPQKSLQANFSFSIFELSTATEGSHPLNSGQLFINQQFLEK
jgi:hypothetical protein